MYKVDKNTAERSGDKICGQQVSATAGKRWKLQ